MDDRRWTAAQARGRAASRGEGAKPYVGTERRSCPRFEPADERAWLVWERGEAYEVVGVRLLDISRQGALVDCKEPPPLHRGESIWFALPASCESGDIPARVVGMSDHPGGRMHIRLRFELDCPDDLFFSAVDGLRAWLALGAVN
jgi:hypothetical protein